MRQIILNKKFLVLTFISIASFLFLFFIFKSSQAQACLPMEGYIVWPGPWEPGRIPMASTSEYILVGSPLFVSGSNVGIGTLSPAYKLQVNGDISGTRLCIGSDCRSVWPGGGVASNGSSGQVAFWTDSTSIGGDNALFWDNTNKRLGIGTTTPQTSLHIVGNVTANTFLGTINAANVSSGQFGANTGGGNYSFPGNVGIGTTTPQARLHVVGNIIADSPTETSHVATKGYVDERAGDYIGFSDPNPRPGYIYTGVIEELDKNWIAKAPMPTARYALAAAVVNDKIYAIGGRSDNGAFLSTNEEYDPSTNTWTTKAPMPTAKAVLAAAVVNNKIYAIGGFSDNGAVLYTNEEYYPSTNTWTTKAPMPTARYALDAAVVNDKIYAIGGISGAVLSVNEEYDPSKLIIFWFRKE